MSRWLFLALFACAALHAEDYCFGFLKAHPDRKEIPEAEANEIQKGHLAHMGKMAAAGRLLAAGPMVTQGGPRGIVVYRCKSLDDARQWTALDPAVQNQRLVLDVYRWRGPDGVGEPLAAKLKADPNTKYNMVRLPLIVLRRTDKWVGDGPMPVLAEHGKQITRQLKEGKVRAAGPFLRDDGGFGADPIGIFIFPEGELEAAKSLAGQDPLVREGYARIEAHMWFVADEAIPK